VALIEVIASFDAHVIGQQRLLPLCCQTARNHHRLPGTHRNL